LKTSILIIIGIVIFSSVTILAFSSIEHLECKIIPTYGNCAHFTNEPPEVDPRFSDATRNGFAVSSNLYIYSIMVEDKIQGISITTSSMPDELIEMDDPLPILQKLFPEKNIQSFIVLSDGMEIAYELEEGKMRTSVTNSNVILIVGFAEL
jgi:hypothetical protein